MGNNIALIKKYTALLDEVYAAASLTADLESDGTLAREGANANEICVPKISMDGLADYDRDAGYTAGGVTLAYETLQYNFDRGRAFSIDRQDNDETAGVLFAKLASEFMRVKVVPELDAFRFATMAGKAGLTTTGAALTSGADAIAAVFAAVQAMDDAEVPAEGRILYITPAVLGAIQALDTTKSRECLDSFAKIVKVPQARFYTAIDQLDGVTGGEEAGGYVKADGAKNINFMIVQPAAIAQYTKAKVDKVISPDDNQAADAWKFCFREYGLSDVYANKVKGVYLHKSNA